ncbi:MAG: hypothetical protein G01um101433_393 [Parcubacteria group bacterium Gr01-1014_33]|nr:MAG: hypothetical protein G01um101433_393 [Parcubacteria group bacterium Gr01-1014_33]
MSRFVFPYGIQFREDSRIEVFPAAELFILGNGGRGIRALFHVDSGATTSVLPASDAAELGIHVAGGKRLIVRGIFAEEFFGYRHNVKAEFNGFRLHIPMIFVDAHVPPILGREGVFSRSGILFDEVKRKIAFLEEWSERKSINTLVG